MGDMTPSKNSPYIPRVELGNVNWYGQMLDFYVSQLFFLHPAPKLNGRFLEIGAYTGLEFTNTLFFEHYLGWTGWLFEPTTCYDLVKANRPRATVFQHGLCPNATEMEFEAFGNTCKSHKAKCTPLTDVEDDSWLQGFDFVSIDVEGNEMDVLKAIDLTKVSVKVLVIEWREKQGDSRKEYLSRFGYVRLTNVLLFNPKRGDEIYYRPDLIQPHVFQP